MKNKTKVTYVKENFIVQVLFKKILDFIQVFNRLLHKNKTFK